MLTEFGKVVRKLRIDHGLTLKEVADQADVSSAYLSGVETGRKPLTTEFVNRVIDAMRLGKAEIDELLRAASRTLDEVKIKRAEGTSETEMEVALMFARRISSGEIDAAKLRKLLEEDF